MVRVFQISKGEHDIFRGQTQSEYFTGIGDYLCNRIEVSRTRFDTFHKKNLRLLPRKKDEKFYKVLLYSGLTLLYLFGLSRWA